MPYEGLAEGQRRGAARTGRRSLAPPVSWVGQNPQLPAATLRENVLLAWPEASDAQLRLALDKAWVSEFIALLPDGIHTAVGDQAGRLSVGQAQRIAVARALLVPLPPAVAG
ncbi:ATP-binding cassette domain-containing protein [Klebsiella variicola subsp. variicola]|nr:ATP-binding cassette domain-containing protein [Klebsiella variicola subsp. variicola]